MEEAAKIGVLALQGDFGAHRKRLEQKGELRKQQLHVHVGLKNTRVLPQLSKTGVSDNVGGVKTFRAHCSMHSEKSAISLSLKKVPFQPKARIVIVSGQELGPTHSSLR